MNTPVFDRRRAERFAQLLDEADGGRRHHLRTPVDHELAPFTALAAQLRDEARTCAELATRRDAVVDPEFRTGLRAMLVATAERDGIGVTAKDPEPAETRPRTIVQRFARIRRTAAVSTASRRPARTRAAVIVGVAAGTLALSGMSAASGDAVPGDTLYGVKRSTERAQLTLAPSDVSRGQLHLVFARTRFTEALTVRDPAVLRGVLEAMDAESAEGMNLLARAAVERRDPEVLYPVEAFVADLKGRLEDLARSTTGASKDWVTGSQQSLDEISTRAKDLRNKLASDCAKPTDGMDNLGPKPNDDCKG